MRFIKIILISVGLLVITLTGLFYGSIYYYSWQDSKFYAIEIPEGENYNKPIKYLNPNQIDSLENLKVDSEKIVVIGTGYGGYDFYMWHKPTEKGELYIKAFEITKEIRLSEWKLIDRTKNTIADLSDNYKLFKGRTVIDEGTFEKFYPTRFELWFKSAKNGEEKKLIEKPYLIDGWDR